MAIVAPKEASQRGKREVLRSILSSSEWESKMVAIWIFGVWIEVIGGNEMMDDIEGSWTDRYYYIADG